jgi:Holliday junction resolvasome RuvABC ATP-dependent DNA helicase subunit
MMKQTQMQKVFFDPSVDRRYPWLPERPTDDQIRLFLARNNTRCPLNRIIVSPENEPNFNILNRMCFSIMKKYNRNPRGKSFGIYCPPGQGKTFIVKRVAETLEIIFVFVQSPMLDSQFTLFELMCDAAAKAGTPIVPDKSKRADYTLPPMIVFFDEAHMINRRLMMGGLLNAMEPDDALMVVKEPGRKTGQFIVDCKDVCWVAATTNREMLFPAFESRFLTAIEWHPATERELSLMIKAGLDVKYKSGEIPIPLPMEACEIIARYQKVPRLAIHSFGVKVAEQKDMYPSDTWEEACETVARELGMDEYGLTKRQVFILQALGQRPTAEGRLGDLCHCTVEHVKRFELPALMQYHNGGPYVVPVSGKGMCITKAGLAQLDKRGLPHKGDRITAEWFESKR